MLIVVFKVDGVQKEHEVCGAFLALGRDSKKRKK